MDLNHHSGLIGLPLLGLPAQWGGKVGDHRLLGYLPNAHDLLSPPGDQYSTVLTIYTGLRSTSHPLCEPLVPRATEIRLGR